MLDVDLDLAMRLLLALIALFALGAVGWLALAPGPEPRLSVGVGPGPDAAASTPVVAPAPLASGDLEGAGPAAQATPDPGPERTAARTAEEREAEQQGEPIVVHVHDEAGAPLVGLEVVLLDRDRYDRAAFRDAEEGVLDERGREALLRRFGQVARTGDDGRVGFTWSGRLSRLWVIADWGLEETRLTRRQVVDGVVTIELGVPPLVAEVRGPDGAPLAGVGVHVRHPYGLAASAGPEGEFGLEYAVTGADGRAYPRGWEPAQRLRDGAPLEALRLELVVHALVRGGMVRAVDREPRAVDPFQFHLPPTAPLEVALVDGRGAPVTDERIRVRVEFGDFGERALELSTYPTRPTSEAPFWVRLARDGAARLEHVELGHALRVEAESLDREWQVEVELPALVEASVARRVELMVDAERKVAFRAVGPDGEALWPAGIGLRFEDEGGGLLFLRELRTDRDGRGEVLLDEATAPDEEQPAPAAMVVRAELDGERHGVTHRFGRPPGRGTTTLGDLVLAPLPRVAAGLVLDPAGAPVRGARVAVLRPLGEDTELTAQEHWALENLGYGGPSPAPPATGWRERAPKLRDETDRDGRFSLRETDVEGDIALRVWSDRGDLFQTEVLPVPLGAEDLVVTLVPGGSIAVRVRHDEVDSVEDHVRVFLEGPAGRTFYGRSGEAPMDRNNLLPGPYDVSVRRAGDQLELARVEGVVVPSAGAASDGRIDPLDLTPHVAVVRLRVEDPDGESVPMWEFFASGSTSVAARFSSVPSRADAADDGSALLLVPRGAAVDGYVTAVGFRPALVRGLEGDAVIRLERGLELEFVLTGLDPALDPTAVGCVLTYDPPAVDELDDLGRGRAKIIRLTFDESGRARGRLAAAGSYRARFSADGRATGFFGNDLQVELEVRETDTTITLPVPEALRAGG